MNEKTVLGADKLNAKPVWSLKNFKVLRITHWGDLCIALASGLVLPFTLLIQFIPFIAFAVNQYALVSSLYIYVYIYI